MKSVICLIGLLVFVQAHAAQRPEIAGLVRLSSGMPVAGVQVMLFDLTDLSRGAVARAMTDEAGYFAFSLKGSGRSPLPQGFALGQNYPNPFNPSTIIPYQLPASGQVRLEVFNVLGQRIATLVDGQRSAGFHTATWNATDVAGRAVGAGVYIYRLSGDEVTLTRRMVLIDGQAGVPAAGAVSARLTEQGIEAGTHVYGLTIAGEGLVTYVDPAFQVRADMAPVDLVVESLAGAPRMKVVADGLLGDVNGDGEVDISDALIIVMYSDSPDTVPNTNSIALGDVNKDGAIDLDDALFILMYIANPADPALPTGMGVYSSLEGDAFDQTVAEIKSLKADLEQNRALVEQAIAEELENNPLNAPKDQFESDADYAARMSQFSSVIAQTRQELREQYGLDDTQAQISRLYRKIFQTNDLTVTLGEYNANEGYFPITWETMLNEGSQRFSETLSLNRDDARNLYNNWDSVIKTGYLAIDPGYRRGLAMVKLEYPPIWPGGGGGFTFYSSLYDLGDNNRIVAFSPDGKYFATGEWENSKATIYYMDGGEEFYQAEHGPRSNDYVYAIAFSPDGEYFVTGGEDRSRTNVLGFSPDKAVFWEMKSGKKVRQMEEGDVKIVAFSPDGRYLATAGLYSNALGNSYGVVSLWEVSSGEMVWESSRYNAESITINALAFSSDGRYLATGNLQSCNVLGRCGLDRVTLWDVSSGEVVQQIEHTGPVIAVAFSPDGRYLATGGFLERVSGQGVVTLWEMDSGHSLGQSIKQLEHVSAINAVAFSPDGKYLAAGGEDQTITFWQIPTGQIDLQTVITKEREISTSSVVRNLVWNPEGRFISDGNKIYRGLLEP